MTRVRESVMRSTECAHGQPQCGDTQGTKKESGRIFATAQIRHLCQVKTLTTKACLKHYDLHKIDNKTGMCLIAAHMKPFFMQERTRHWD